MNDIKIRNNWLILCLVCFIGFSGCKNQQKVADQQAAAIRAENISKSKEILLSILNDDGEMSLAEKERKLRQAKALNSDDPEVQRLIGQVEELIQMERDGAKAPDEAVKVDPTLEQNLDDLFADISSASSASVANGMINDGLSMFSSPQTPVLIIVSQSGSVTDYDQPTTIERYLNYLKDHKVSPNEVYKVKKDNS